MSKAEKESVMRPWKSPIAVTLFALSLFLASYYVLTSSLLISVLALLITVVILSLVSTAVVVYYAHKKGYFINHRSLRFELLKSELQRNGTNYVIWEMKKRYDQKVAISVGVGSAIALALFGLIFGPVFDTFAKVLFSFEGPIVFRSNELRTLWAVHATIITLSLVGLSFAWESVRDLETTDDIIAEAAERLRSIEAITFLLASNLSIGFCVLLSEGKYVTSSLGFSVGVLFLFGIIVTGRRYWIVFDLLLFSALDELVLKLAENELTRLEQRNAANPSILMAKNITGTEKDCINISSVGMQRRDDTIVIQAEEINKVGQIVDMNLSSLNRVSLLVDSCEDGEVLSIPRLGYNLRESSIVFAAKDNLDDCVLKNIKNELNQGISTKGSQ